MAVLAQGRTLGAVRTQVDGRVKHRLLAHPDAVFHHRIHRAAHRAVGANGALDLDLAFAHRDLAGGGARLLDQRQLRGRQPDAHTQTRAAQKGAAVHGGQGLAQATAQTVNKR